MSAKKADKPRYWLTYLLEDLPVGAAFKPSALHLTIIPWFVTELGEAKVIESFRRTFSGLPVLELTVGKQDEFNHKRRILINHVGPKAKLESLHRRALDWLAGIEGRWALEYPRVDEEFIPHIRRREDTQLGQGDRLLMSSLSLVKAFRRGDDYREVAAKVRFDEKD